MCVTGVFDRWQVRCPGKHAKGITGGQRVPSPLLSLPQAPNPICKPRHDENSLIWEEEFQVSIISVIFPFSTLFVNHEQIDN